ncbi:MAG TPA: patatin-like phospholipase family protein [Rhodanobacteraceae bacterium]|nr:patatin-like phospholipase family protein [Rhodanobacteraceae bacterium]
MSAQVRRVAPARKKTAQRPPAGKRSTNIQVNKAPKPPALAARDYETVVLVLQGGGALGAYQCGVYEGLDAAGIQPDWFAGISIGAINAAILAGNAPERRVERLREFWQRISSPALPLPPEAFDWQRQWLDALPKYSPLQALANSAGAMTALLHGQQGFFVPRLPPPYAATPGSNAATSFYSTAPLRATLDAFVDFDRVNHASAPRLTLGAVNLRSGNFVYFDNRRIAIGVEHVLASAALPPAFPPVEIDGEFYWDGGLVSNTPLEYVLELTPRRDTLALQVDLWSAHGELPRTLGDVLERQKDIQYSSRTRRGTDTAAEQQRLRLALGELIELLPGKRVPPALAGAFSAWTCTKVVNIVHLIYQAKSYEQQYKDYAFGPLAMSEHWSAGLGDMQRTLACPHYFALPSRDVGVVTHDIHR